MLLSDYTTQVQFLVHDQSNSDFTQTELTNAINDARIVVAEDFQCCRQTLLAPPTNAPNPTSYNPVSVITNQELYPLVGSNGLAGRGYASDRHDCRYWRRDRRFRHRDHDE